MKILFVSNYYPPCRYGGGYMQLCEEVANGLSARGHEIAVLTSTCGVGDSSRHSYPVHRSLIIDPDWHSTQSVAWQFFLGRKARERHAVTIFEQLVNDLEPDFVFIWHPIGLSREMLSVAETLPHTTAVFYLADYWPELSDEYLAYWERPAVSPVGKWSKRFLAQIARRMLVLEGKPIRLELAHVFCVSDYVRQRLVHGGLASPNAVTIHNGIDVELFSPRHDAQSRPTDVMRCLVAGRLVPEKGVHTVLEALYLLKDDGCLDQLVLNILGSGEATYIEMLEQRTSDYGLTETVTFPPLVSRDQMPDVLRNHDILIASAEYDEPLARMVQEAMGCGLVVVGTTTGGSTELLSDEKNGLTFKAGDPTGLAHKLRRMLEAPPEFRQKLAKAARETVVESFDIQQTIAHVEKHLSELTCAQQPANLE